MGNRLAEGVCVMCGGPLIVINDWHTCSGCTEDLKKMQHKVLAKQKISKRPQAHIKLHNRLAQKIGVPIKA